MHVLKMVLFAMFRPFATARDVRGGGGHFNEQCHPQVFN